MNAEFEFQPNDPEQLLERLSALESHAAGETIEMLTQDGVWAPVKNPSWMNHFRYRRAPVPKRVPWSKPEHVPGPVCWLKIGNDLETWDTFVSSIFNQGCAVVRRHDTIVYTWKDIEKYGILHSTDRKEWKPCTTTDL